MQTAQAEAEKEVRLFADKSSLLLAVLNGFGILKGLSLLSAETSATLQGAMIFTCGIAASFS